MDETSAGSRIMQFSALAAIALAIVGVLTRADPLTSNRPAGTGYPVERNLGNQDVPARLWQDPFDAARAALPTRYSENARPTTTPTSTPNPKTRPGDSDLTLNPLRYLQEQFGPGQGQDVLLMPVLIDAEPYAERQEQRIRTRIAIVEGLSRRDFLPVNSERIGCVHLQGSLTAPSNSASEGRAESLLVPYEWFSYSGPGTPQTRRILVLWVNEEALGDLPLSGLSTLLGRIAPRTVRGNATIRILGPRVSETLRKVAAEAAGECVPELSELRDARLYSPSATADDRNVVPSACGNISVANIFRAKGLPVSLARTTITDDRVCQALVEELDRRDVAVGADSPVAIVAELDTTYGRQLRESFVTAATTKYGWEAEKSIYPFFYLRGIDGRSTFDAKPAENARKETPADQSRLTYAINPATEAPESLNQSDYLRRLAGELVRLDAALKRDGKALRSVGVLGTDVYDKLLVLRALRSQLPNCLFFTIGVDARYALATEWPATQNLIVASDFGLSLHRAHQENTAPFRDSTQTAVFATTIAIADEAAPRDPRVPFIDKLTSTHVHPRIFEVGRPGFYDLSIVSPPVRTDAYQYWTTSASPTAPLHPDRTDGVLFTNRQWTLIAIVASLIGAVALLGWYLGIRPQKFQIMGIVSNGPIMVAVGLIVGTCLCLLLSVLNWPENEPMSLAGGVSVWPTVILRIVATFLAVATLLRAWIRTSDSNKDVSRMFNLPNTSQDEVLQTSSTPPTSRWQKLRAFVRTKLSYATWQVYAIPIRSEIRDPEFNLSCDPGERLSTDQRIAGPPSVKPTLEQISSKSWRSVDATAVWKHYYVRLSLWRRSLRPLLALIIMLLAVPAGAELLGWPTTPARGSVANVATTLSGLLVLVSSGFLLLAVFDGTYLNRRFIRYLCQQTTTWPKGVFDKFSRFGVAPYDLTEFIDIQFIAERTRVVGDAPYFVFPVFLLMIVARSSIFDHWDWPASLILGYSIWIGIALIGALMLRNAAEEARQLSIRCITARIRRDEQKLATAAHGSEHAAALQRSIYGLQAIRNEVQKERRGAFSLLSNHPMIAAILLPSSGLGLWALLEQLPRWLN